MSFLATLASTLGVETRTRVLVCRYFGPMPERCVTTLTSATSRLQFDNEVYLEVAPKHYVVLQSHKGEARIAFSADYDIMRLNTTTFTWSVIDAVLPAELNPTPLKTRI